MNKNHLKFSAFAIVFAALVFGYIYFEEQTFINSGNDNTNTIVQILEDGDEQSVKDKLVEYIGGQPAGSEAFDQAIVSIDFVAGLLDDGQTLEFKGDGLTTNNGNRVYSAVYSIDVPDVGENYLVVVMRNQNSEWLLSNIQLKSENPFKT